METALVITKIFAFESAFLAAFIALCRINSIDLKIMRWLPLPMMFILANIFLLDGADYSSIFPPLFVTAIIFVLTKKIKFKKMIVDLITIVNLTIVFMVFISCIGLVAQILPGSNKIIATQVVGFCVYALLQLALATFLYRPKSGNKIKSYYLELISDRLIKRYNASILFLELFLFFVIGYFQSFSLYQDDPKLSNAFDAAFFIVFIVIIVLLVDGIKYIRSMHGQIVAHIEKAEWIKTVGKSEVKKVSSFYEVDRIKWHDMTKNLNRLTLRIKEKAPYDELLSILEHMANININVAVPTCADTGSNQVNAVIKCNKINVKDLDIEIVEIVRDPFRVSDFKKIDENSIASFIDNNIENAIQELSAKKIRNGQVIVEFTRIFTIMHITIKSNSEPIPTEIRNKMFDLGFSTKGENRGIGLAMIKNYLKDIGGDITFFNDGQYNCFEIALETEGGGSSYRKKPHSEKRIDYISFHDL